MKLGKLVAEDFDDEITLDILGGHVDECEDLLYRNMLQAMYFVVVPDVHPKFALYVSKDHLDRQRPPNERHVILLEKISSELRFVHAVEDQDALAAPAWTITIKLAEQHAQEVHERHGSIRSSQQGVPVLAGRRLGPNQNEIGPAVQDCTEGCLIF